MCEMVRKWAQERKRNCRQQSEAFIAPDRKKQDAQGQSDHVALGYETNHHADRKAGGELLRRVAREKRAEKSLQQADGLENHPESFPAGGTRKTPPTAHPCAQWSTPLIDAESNLRSFLLPKPAHPARAPATN